MALSVEIDRLMDACRIRLPATTDRALRSEMFNVLDEFCRTTDIWRDTLEVQLTEGAAQYPLVGPSGTQTVRVLGALHNGIPLARFGEGSPDGSSVITMRGRIQADQLLGDQFLYNPDETVPAGGIFSFSVYFPEYIVFSTTPSGDAVNFPVIVGVSLAPSAEGDLQIEDFPFPDGFLQRYHQLILDGVQWRMMSQIGKPYSSERMAIYHGRRFRSFMAQARSGASRGYMKASQPWVYPSWTR